MLAVDCLGAVGCIRVGVAVRVGSAKRAPGGQMISIRPGRLLCVCWSEAERRSGGSPGVQELPSRGGGAGQAAPEGR